MVHKKSKWWQSSNLVTLLCAVYAVGLSACQHDLISSIDAGNRDGGNLGNPDNPENPEDSGNPENPINPENPENPKNPEVTDAGTLPNNVPDGPLGDGVGEVPDERNLVDAGNPARPDAGQNVGQDAGQVEQDAGNNADVCDPEAHVLPNVGLTEAIGQNGCPDGMIYVAAATPFCIDQYEASLLEVTDTGDVEWSPYFNPANRRVRAVSRAGAVPQGYINGEQAKNACALSQKRLCTDAEWLRACQGNQNNTFPYGAVRQAGVCNDSRSQHPAVEYFHSADASVFSHIDHPCLNQLPNGLLRTGTKTGCVTAEGAFDMMGNLHEWTADPNGTFRGGFYVDTVVNGPGCLYRTTAHNTLHWDYSTGFRCCADL